MFDALVFKRPCPIRARSLAGFRACAGHGRHCSCDCLVPFPAGVLIAKCGCWRGVAAPVHELGSRGPRLCRRRQARMSKVVQVQFRTPYPLPSMVPRFL